MASASRSRGSLTAPMARLRCKGSNGSMGPGTASLRSPEVSWERAVENLEGRGGVLDDVGDAFAGAWASAAVRMLRSDGSSQVVELQHIPRIWRIHILLYFTLNNYDPWSA